MVCFWLLSLLSGLWLPSLLCFLWLPPPFSLAYFFAALPVPAVLLLVLLAVAFVLIARLSILALGLLLLVFLVVLLLVFLLVFLILLFGLFYRHKPFPFKTSVVTYQVYPRERLCYPGPLWREPAEGTYHATSVPSRVFFPFFPSPLTARATEAILCSSSNALA